VLRILLAIVSALLLGQALAPAGFAAAEVCTAGCPDDGPDGEWSRTCVVCGCCQAPRCSVACCGVPAPVTPDAPGVATGGDSRLPARDPQDVFHVPRPRPA
jgi:hypothetical protein